MKKKRNRSAISILKKRFPPSAEDQALSEGYRQSFNIAQQVYDLRIRAGLTQKQLADRVGTTASVISRLEDADYDRHSMAMLRRIASAAGHKVEVRFIPDTDAAA